jgi:hypothetical protein
MIIFVAAVAALLIFASISFQIWQRRIRASRFQGLVLKPNCLLTRYPIAFLSGPRTVFRLFDHWNDVPLFLREHGYEVYVIEPSGRTLSERTESVCAALESLQSRCHLVADGSLEQDMESLASMKLAYLSSFTVVKTAARERYPSQSTSISPRDLKPLASAVEIFEVPADILVQGFSAKLKLLLLSGHNFLIKRRTLFVHPFETAEVSSGFASEERFLDLAISLAERDVIGSD